LWRKENAAGKGFNAIRYLKGNASDERNAGGISDVNYFANFRNFMKQRQKGQPFYFWYGAKEPHRGYEKDSWVRNGKHPESVVVPGFLPDCKEIRGDILDYAIEIDWFDLHLTRMLNYLDSIGVLDNTIVLVTSDNGMSFPRAKANCFEYGVHVPLAISFPKGFPGNRTVNDVVSFVDFAPTLLEMTGTKPDGMLPISGKSIVNILKSDKAGIVDEQKKYVFSGRERHSSSRWNNLGYPQRAIHSAKNLFIWNMKPERWPAGDPQALKDDSDSEFAPMYGIDEKGIHHSDWAFTDVDASPSKSYIIEHHDDNKIRYYFDLAFGKQPEFELFDLVKDPNCLNNLYGKKEHSTLSNVMKSELIKELEKSKDPRIVGPNKEIFDSYLRYDPIRRFPKPIVEGIK
jgi:uncharacterized sulfatase